MNSVAAREDEVRAQQRLHEWASGTAETTFSCGIPVTHRIGFQALAELIDGTLADSRIDALDLDTDPISVGPGLSAALQVIDQTTLDDAAAAAWMLSYDGAHAPINLRSRITITARCWLPSSSRESATTYHPRSN